MRIYLCDDELKIREEICARVKDQLPEAEVSTYSDGTELLKRLKEQSCDLLLLDIDIPKVSGMEVAERLSELQKKPLLIFVTGHDELVYESFQYHPFGFVRKQFLETELKKVLTDGKTELEQKERHFNFRTAEGEHKILLGELLYFESEGNYVKVYAADGEYRFRSTIAAVESALKRDGFLRIHKGFLVNQTAICLFGADAVELTDGSSLPVGKTYAEDAKQQFMRYLRS